MENAVYFARTGETDLSAAARRLLADALGFSPRIEKGAHGNPFLPAYPGIHISIAHTRGAVACAVFDRPVGIDLERPRRINPALAKKYFTPAEQAYALDAEQFIEVWTRKEAWLKREGVGFASVAPVSSIETWGNPETATFCIEGFTISVCAAPPRFVFVQTRRPPND